ncbi:hypothetical protein CWIS_11130 [Cellulomonas sp. A375-1]|uniref:FMN-binding protein n=1 Tax=Cellulomonas sp. A375-1 TaxID=1672219 RepID=UPI0006527DEA|nr:FMN-binding protein [Cellulomonas sp. A375-1]KMM45305.1 hypothetical protein CWIS_11130 [Cellulomonas sp. A375-1]
MTKRWRGTLLFTGTVAAMGAAGFAKFGALAAPEAAVSAASASESAPSGASSSSGASAEAPASSGSSGSSSDAASTPDASPTTDGTATVVGDAVDTRYGPVQVAVTFAGGQIASVQTLQSPDGHGESVQINRWATPILAQEVVAAQSAQIDTVSGATYTSQAYATSVQSAIDQRG